MPSSNQGLWPESRLSLIPWRPRGPDDHYLSVFDATGNWGDRHLWATDVPFAGHYNKLFDYAYKKAADARYGVQPHYNYNTPGNLWAPYAMVGGSAYKQYGSNPISTWYWNTFDADTSNPAEGGRGYDPDYVFPQHLVDAFHGGDGGKSVPDYAYNDALIDRWIETGAGDQSYQDELDSARDAALREMRFNYLRRGLSGSNVDQYLREQVNRIYSQNKDNPLSEAELRARMAPEAASLYQDYRDVYAENVPAITGGNLGAAGGPGHTAWHSRPTEPTTALANQHYDSTPDINMSGLNLGDLFAGMVNKYPPSAQRRKLTAVPAVPEQVLDAEISTFFGEESAQPVKSHKGTIRRFG